MIYFYFLLVLMVILLAWGYLETWRLRAIQTQYRSSQVPKTFQGYRIALIGNLHLRHLGRREKWIQATLLKWSPDILLIAGNLKPTHAAEPEQVHQRVNQFLAPLQFKDGILAVRGYHDRKHFWDQSRETETSQVCKPLLLSNTFYTVRRDEVSPAAVHFIGIQTAHAAHLDRGQNQLRETLESVPSGGLRILLGQSADLLRIAQGHPIDLILAVDNLHYQLRLPGIGVVRRDSKVPWSWTTGWRQEGPLSLYLSPGVGWFRYPFRFLMRPEMTLVELVNPDVGGEGEALVVTDGASILLSNDEHTPEPYCHFVDVLS